MKVKAFLAALAITALMCAATAQAQINAEVTQSLSASGYDSGAIGTFTTIDTGDFFTMNDMEAWAGAYNGASGTYNSLNLADYGWAIQASQVSSAIASSGYYGIAEGLAQNVTDIISYGAGAHLDTAVDVISAGGGVAEGTVNVNVFIPK